jgi:replication factor C small subunit
MPEKAEVWREQYRPSTISELVGLEKLKRDIKGWMKGNSVSRPTNLVRNAPAALLFAGPPGTGKTTVAEVIAREMFGQNEDLLATNFHEFNASDERGIDFIRDNVKQTARINPIGVSRKVIFLDEADGLTKPAQEALRRTMEKYSDKTMFILAVNSKPAIIPAIQSRCVTYDFAPYSEAEVADLMGRLQKHLFRRFPTSARQPIFPSEWTDSYDLLRSATGGDLRQCVDLLQSTAKEPDALHERLVGLSRDLSNPALSVAIGDYESLRVELKRLSEGGLSNLEMLRRLHQFVRTLGMDAERFTSYSSVWGDFVMKATAWPLSSDDFIDYFVSALQVTSAVVTQEN